MRIPPTRTRVPAHLWWPFAAWRGRRSYHSATPEIAVPAVDSSADAYLISLLRAIPDTRTPREHQDSYPIPAGGVCHRDPEQVKKPTRSGAL